MKSTKNQSNPKWSAIQRTPGCYK